MSVAECDDIECIHLMFDRHEVISAEGVLTENFFPGQMALGPDDAEMRAELERIFPQLRGMSEKFAETAHYCLNSKEAKLVDLDWLVTAGEQMVLVA